jgi:hypothetical protein
MAALAPLWPSVALLLERGMTSMAATVAFGLVLAAEVPLLDMPLLLVAPWSCIMLDVPEPPCEPDVSYPLELPAAPELPDEPEEPEEPDEPEDPLPPPQLPAPCDPVPPPVPDMPLLPDVPLLPVSPAAPLLPLLPMPRQELHADSPTASASKLARKTLWCLCFMINSF